MKLDYGFCRFNVCFICCRYAFFSYDATSPFRAVTELSIRLFNSQNGGWERVGKIIAEFIGELQDFMLYRTNGV